MGTLNICLYKEVDKKYTGCNLNITELLDYARIAVCVVIRSNTVSMDFSRKTYYLEDWIHLQGEVALSKLVLSASKKGLL